MNRVENINSLQSRATSLIELMTSMAILAILLAVLAATLQASLGQFRASIDQSQSSQGVQFAKEWLRRDLSFAANAFPANLPPLPPGLIEEQIDFFSDTIFFPFEVDRESGTDAPTEAGFPFRNANFGSLAFSRMDRVNPNLTSLNSPSTTYPTLALVGYYVAYTPDGITAENPRFSMKLFRHYRPPGNYGDGYAEGFFRFCHRQINDDILNSEERANLPITEENLAAVRQGLFNNEEVPFLFSRRLMPDVTGVDLDSAGSPPFPEYTSSTSNLFQQLGDEQAWRNPDDAVHDLVFPDEAIAENVIRFEVSPHRIMEDEDGNQTVMDATEVSQRLSLKPNGEWPCLVSPTYLEFVLGIVDEEIAARLNREEDWIIDWSDGASSRNDLEELVKANTKTQRFRISIGGGK